MNFSVSGSVKRSLQFTKKFMRFQHCASRDFNTKTSFQHRYVCDLRKYNTCISQQQQHHNTIHSTIRGNCLIFTIIGTIFPCSLAVKFLHFFVDFNFLLSMWWLQHFWFFICFLWAWFLPNFLFSKPLPSSTTCVYSSIELFYNSTYMSHMKICYELSNFINAN